MSGQQGAVANLLVPVVFLAMFYFLLIRPNQKREKAIKAMRASLKVGDEVMTIGGIGGKIISLDETSVVLEVAPDQTRLSVERWGIGRKSEVQEDIADAIIEEDLVEEEGQIQERILEENEFENEE